MRALNTITWVERLKLCPSSISTSMACSGKIPKFPKMDAISNVKDGRF
jgi:hypothetical protein